MHATPGTTGSALRLLTERADRAFRLGQRFRAVAFVPDGSSSALSGITRHMAAVSRVPAGQSMLESFGTGAWRPVPARRGFTLSVYPRPAGDATMPVVTDGWQRRRPLWARCSAWVRCRRTWLCPAMMLAGTCPSPSAAFSTGRARAMGAVRCTGSTRPTIRGMTLTQWMWTTSTCGRHCAPTPGSTFRGWALSHTT
eukprot:1991818-Prymnesium_polylepis.2